MALHHAMDVQRHVKVYILVFGALALLTVMTVLVSYLKHSVATGVLIALVIATVKGSLVACYFMHLITERKMIYAVLLFTGVFFLALMLLMIAAYKDQEGSQIQFGDKPITQQEAGHVP